MQSQEHLGLESREALSPIWQLGSSMVDCPLPESDPFAPGPESDVPLIQGLPGRSN
jgi:hypothetical protein